MAQTYLQQIPDGNLNGLLPINSSTQNELKYITATSTVSYNKKRSNYNLER